MGSNARNMSEQEIMMVLKGVFGLKNAYIKQMAKIIKNNMEENASIPGVVRWPFGSDELIGGGRIRHGVATIGIDLDTAVVIHVYKKWPKEG